MTKCKTADIDRLLGLADQFLEEWAEDCVQNGEPDPEYEARQAEWTSVRPLLLAAPAMHTQLKRIQGWLFTDLLHADRPLCKESAAKALQEINELLNPLEAL